MLTIDNGTPGFFIFSQNIAEMNNNCKIFFKRPDCKDLVLS